MEIKNIDKYFAFEILRRGYDYYKKGRVKNITKVNNEYIASVSGSETYQVTIDIKSDHYDMQCTCPYAENANCKHMAAVLYCLKNDSIPVKESKVQINSEDLIGFEKFKKAFKKEYNKLFHGRTYIHENELEDYIELIDAFIKETSKYIGKDNELAYNIFEYLVINVDGLDVYDMYGEKENIFENLFKTFNKIFEEETIFINLLTFINMFYEIDSDIFYFEHKENILNLLYSYIKYKWQAEDTLVLLNKINNSQNTSKYQKRKIKTQIVFLNYYYIDKNKALKLANENLDINEICDFLLDLYKDNKDKKIELLKKIINANKPYSNDKYYKKLLSIYKKESKEKYLALLDNYFKEHESMEIYEQLKKAYTKKEWDTKKYDYISTISNEPLYRDICATEGLYDELLTQLKKAYIEVINKYLNELIHHKPKEILILYSNKLKEEIDYASSRQHYQKILTYFKNILKIPHGKEEVQKLIKYIREHYKNRKAMQEEIDFFEETFMQ